MSHYKVGDEVWWFCVDSTTGNVYPEWLRVCNGTVVWKSPHEEIMHVYVDGSTFVYVLLDDDSHVFPSRDIALGQMTKKMHELEFGHE